MASAATPCSAIVETEPGIVWIGTSNGLDRLDRGARTSSTHFTEADGLPGTTVNGLAPTPPASSGSAAIAASCASIPRRRRRSATPSPTGCRGASSTPRVLSRRATARSSSAAAKGFNMLRARANHENDARPADRAHRLPALQQAGRRSARRARRSSRASSSRSKLVLHHDQSVFTIEFAALDFVAPEQEPVRVQARGDRLASGTRSAAKRTASYTNLPAGSYIFRVKGTNNDGVWNEEGASLAHQDRAALLGVVVVPRDHPARRGVRGALRPARAARAAREPRAHERHARRSGRARSALAAVPGAERARGARRDGALLRGRSLRRARRRARRRDRPAPPRREQGRAQHPRRWCSRCATCSTRRCTPVWQIQAETNELSRGAEEQISQTLLVAGAAQQMAQTVSSSASSIAEASEIAQRSGTEAHEGGRIVRDTFAGMDEIVTPSASPRAPSKHSAAAASRSARSRA